ncbi:MAG: type II secretory pathway protein ExeA [Isosphaeraceae bacterium]|nr:type II secretory pathway protein ExeA [Isosphaeraceae bacterium]
MVERHWKLRRDPFAGNSPCYVATPVHAEAEARLVHALTSGDRRVVLRAEAGLGKSLLLARVLDRVREPTRRVVRVASPTDGASLFAACAEGLGGRLPPDPGRPRAWRALADAARLCRLQGQAIVLAVDDDQGLNRPEDRLDLDRLVHLDPHPEARVSVLRVGRLSEEEPSDPWELVIRLLPLTRSEAEQYLSAKLAAAGRDEPTFTPRALTRLHALSGGVPRGLDRLASLALMAGAARGLEIIPPEVVEAAALECAGALEAA